MKIVRRLALSVAVIAALAIAFTAWLTFQPSPTGFAGGTHIALSEYTLSSPTGLPRDVSLTGAVARGVYVTRMADCEACHTAKGGTPFSGGRAFKLPFGTIYTPNLTPDGETGIGRWTDAEFVRAVHRGIGRDGKRLYPAFPYGSYAMMTDADVLAIKAYLFSLKPVHAPTAPNTFVFPFNQRWLMIFWSTLFNRTGEFQPTGERSPAWNRGAYLVEATGHCAECHTPRNVMQAMDQRQKFAGGQAEGWNAYNISGDAKTGVGAWSQGDIASYLSTGHAQGRGTASGPMAEVVSLSTSHLSPSDIRAIALYLKSVPGQHSANLSDTLAGAAPASPRAGRLGDPAGKRIFEGACASCHSWTGAGALVSQADLTGSRAVNDPSAVNVAQMILSGTGPQRAGRPYMPAFGAAYSDREIADTANFVTTRFGSHPSHVDAKDVARLRGAN
ncbi:c-type cytochrome [Sphingomonas sp. UYP23]